MSLKTKAKTSVTITITITLILFSFNAWEDYKVRYKDSIRSIEIENVERLKKCRTPSNGYKTYQCPECGKKKYVPFTCKCRLCTSCGTKAANQWADRIHHILLKLQWKRWFHPQIRKARKKLNYSGLEALSVCGCLG